MYVYYLWFNFIFVRNLICHCFDTLLYLDEPRGAIYPIFFPCCLAALDKIPSDQISLLRVRKRYAFFPKLCGLYSV